MIKRLTFPSEDPFMLDSKLFVRRTFENETRLRIQKAPTFGESGWDTGWTPGPGSAIPIGIH